VAGSNLEPGFRAFSSRAASELEEVISTAATSEQLDSAVKCIWAGVSDGSIGEADAVYLQSIVDLRRPARTVGQCPNITPIGHGLGRVISRFKSRQHPRSPDRQKSRERRRTLAGSGALPPCVRHYYTEGQRAVLTIITFEIRGDGAGVCMFPVDKIAAKAGVCRTTVQSALHEARRLGHITVEERPRAGRNSLTNVVKVIWPEWNKWIQRGSFSVGTIGSNLAKKSSPTKTRDIKKGNTAHRNESEFVDHNGYGPSITVASPRALGVDVVWPTSLRGHGSE
jgi:hypothetical protein